MHKTNGYGDAITFLEKKCPIGDPYQQLRRANRAMDTKRRMTYATLKSNRLY